MEFTVKESLTGLQASRPFRQPQGLILRYLKSESDRMAVASQTLCDHFNGPHKSKPANVNTCVLLVFAC